VHPVPATLISTCVILSFIQTAVAFSAEESPTPRQLAEKFLEAERNDEHRERIRVTWPDEPAAAPAGTEIFLIDGYIDYRCRRLVWDGKAVHGESIETRRSWFYNPQGETFITSAITLDPERFQTAWNAAMLLAAMSAKDLDDKDPNAPFHSRSGGTSSHERTKWVRLSRPAGVDYLRASRGHMSTNGLEDFDSIQNRALYALLDSFLPPLQKPALATRKVDAPDERTAADARKANAAALARWAQIMAAELPRVTLPEDGKPDRIQRTLLEPALRILGEAGHAAATESIQSLSSKLKSVGEDYGAKSVLEEAFFALTKIEFLTHWNTEKAVQMIRSNPHAKHAQNDLSKWLRKRLHTQDAPGYHAALLEDITDRPNDEALLCEDIAELSLHYREVSVDVLRGLMKNPNAEVATTAALAVLLARPDDAEALAVLEHIASDPSVGIDPGAYYFNRYARDRALNVFIGYREAGKPRWTTERIRKQALLPNEDGRIIKNLFTYLGTEKDYASISLSIWRRVLTGPRNRGAVMAIEELMERKDVDSIPQIEALLTELESSCNRSGPVNPDREAKYPWASSYELEALRTKLKNLSSK